MRRHILHVDCNCFYASVEMQEHPSYRGRPIAVCGDPQARHGIVLTASYPAKRLGVKTGMAIWQAKQCCSELLVVPAHTSEYIRYSGFIREIFERYTDQVEPFGLDESWLDVTGSLGVCGSALTIAHEISEQVKRELGITVSIGVAENKIAAKLGSDYRKPDAITRIEADNYVELAYPLPVGDLLYVGPATQRKLHWYGIHTIGQLAQVDPEVLHGWIGKMGYVLSAFARGADNTPVAKMGQAAAIKSIGNSATTPRDLTCEQEIWVMLVILAESVAARMRELAVKCTVVEISVRDCDLQGFIRQTRLEGPTCNSLEIAQAALGLFRRSYTWTKPIRSIGVRGSGLTPQDTPVQLSFTMDEPRREKRQKLDQAVDRLRSRYGYTSVQRAVVHTDSQLGNINPKEDHAVHPVGFFNAG